MSVKTQGTMLYVIDPTDGSALEVECVVNFDGLDVTREQIETTCLSSDTRTYVSGLGTPGTASFTINANPNSASHVRLHQLYLAGNDLTFAVGWSDGTAAPTTMANSAGEFEFVLPTTRTWIEFEGFINSFPFSFAQNTVVTSTIGVQVSGSPVWVQKA